MLYMIDFISVVLTFNNINDTVGVCCNSEGLGDDEHNSDNYRGLYICHT